MAVSSSDKEYKNNDTWVKAPLILIAVFIGDKSKYKNIYEKIGKGMLSPKALYEYLNTLNFSNTNDKKYFLLLTLTFILTKDNDVYKEEAEEILKPYKKSLDDLRPVYHCRVSEDFPDSESTFQAFYKKLEEWRSFIE